MGGHADVSRDKTVLRVACQGWRAGLETTCAAGVYAHHCVHHLLGHAHLHCHSKALRSRFSEKVMRTLQLTPAAPLQSVSSCEHTCESWHFSAQQD